jgi:hypothetical protein
MLWSRKELALGNWCALTDHSIALLGPYLWFCAWTLRQAWPPLRGWGAAIELGTTGGEPIPALLVWGVLLPGCIWLAWASYSGWRQAAECYAKAIRMLGFKRTVHGVLLMSIVRLRLPQRDFFLQSPIFRACLKSHMRGHVIVGVMTISTDVDKLYDTDLSDP